MPTNKVCVACGEEILETAKLCKHCKTEQDDPRFAPTEGHSKSNSHLKNLNCPVCLKSDKVQSIASIVGYQTSSGGFTAETTAFLTRTRNTQGEINQASGLAGTILNLDGAKAPNNVKNFVNSEMDSSGTALGAIISLVVGLLIFGRLYFFPTSNPNGIELIFVLIQLALSGYLALRGVLKLISSALKGNTAKVFKAENGLNKLAEMQKSYENRVSRIFSSHYCERCNTAWNQDQKSDPTKFIETEMAGYVDEVHDVLACLFPKAPETYHMNLYARIK